MNSKRMAHLEREPAFSLPFEADFNPIIERYRQILAKWYRINVRAAPKQYPNADEITKTSNANKGIRLQEFMNLRRRGASEADAKLLIRLVLQQLQRLHDQALIYEDLRPENVVIHFPA